MRMCRFFNIPCSDPEAQPSDGSAHTNAREVLQNSGWMRAKTRNSSRVLSAESSLRPVPVVANLSLERLIDRFNVFFLALCGLGSVSRTGLDWRQSAFGFHHPRAIEV
jgi:hypothetical protein